MDFAKHKGHLSVFTMDEQGTCSTPQKILETPYHLSYPFIFEHRGTYYLVPETLSRKTIQLYQCIEFPHKWKFVKNLIDNISAVDATLIHYRNRWWLFATVVENNGVLPWDELFLFHSKDLFADTWTPHPKNPIVSDVRKARPAGRIFEHHGYLIRPSQDCSKRYGYGIVFNKIVTMNEMEYIEKEVQTMTPDWDKRIKGIHSFDHKNNLTIIDGFIRRRKYF